MTLMNTTTVHVYRFDRVNKSTGAEPSSADQCSEDESKDINDVSRNENADSVVSPEGPARGVDQVEQDPVDDTAPTLSNLGRLQGDAIIT